MNGRLALAIVAGLGLGYGIANHGLEYLFPAPERVETDRPAVSAAAPEPGQTALVPRADRSAKRRSRGSGTPPSARSGLPSPEEEMDARGEDLARTEGEGFVDEDHERQVREITERIERLELMEFPEPVQENLSDEELLAQTEAGIAQAMEALEQDLAARREEERRLEDAAREN